MQCHVFYLSLYNMNVKVKFWLDVAVLPWPQPHLACLQSQAMVEAELQRRLRHVLPGCHPGMTKTDAGEIKKRCDLYFLRLARRTDAPSNFKLKLLCDKTVTNKVLID